MDIKMENETADEDTFSPEDTDPDFLVLYMNLQDPLVNLRKIIEKRLNLNAGHLQEFEFYLQDNQLVRMIYFFAWKPKNSQESLCIHSLPGVICLFYFVAGSQQKFN
jgi:hypothetical protein